MSYSSVPTPFEKARLNLQSYFHILFSTNSHVTSTLSTLLTHASHFRTLLLRPPRSVHDDMLALGAMQCVLRYTGIIRDVERCLEELQVRVEGFIARGAALDIETAQLGEWLSRVGEELEDKERVKEKVKRMKSWERKGRELVREAEEFVDAVEEGAEYLLVPPIFDSF